MENYCTNCGADTDDGNFYCSDKCAAAMQSQD
jgi:predicted nucleic acid-binding Zn ribbon protein